MKRSVETLICKVFYSPLGDKLATLLGLYNLYAEYKVRTIKKKQLSYAMKEFNKESALGSFDDYNKALDKYWVSYSEYANQYEFYTKSEEERDEYVSRLKMAYFYWRYVPGKIKRFFRSKINFLGAFRDYVYRKWLFAPESSFSEFQQMITNYDCIVKPNDGKLGKGVFKVYKNGNHKTDKELYEKCVKNNMLVEQCIESCDELKAFHPQSLNTIRVVTISNMEKSVVFGAVFRVGVGNNVVDNAHAGGLFAQINVKDGIIESDGIDTKGKKFICHPDSGIKFIGFKIPHWDSIVETCCEAAKIKGNPITGWDVAVNNQGKVEFVEGNYSPDFDLMQSQVGVKKRIYDMIKDYCNIEMN